MSMSAHIVGFVPPDEKWEKMKQVYDACKAAGIDPPDRVIKFFGGEAPDPAGVERHLDVMTRASAVKAWSAEHGASSGFEVDLRKLDPDIKILRFYNSW
jgi:hypothetical protein